MALVNEVTRAAQLTPVGRGAIGVVGVRGPRAIACVSRCFHSKSGYSLPQIPVGRILLGDWYPPATADLLFHSADRSHTDANWPVETAGEELIVCRVSSDELEVHCHGGQAAVGNVMASLQQCGCELVPWSDFLIGPPDADPHAQAAWAALPRATTNRVAAVLLDQAQGALDQAFLKIEAALKERDAAMAAERIDAVLRYASVGCHLVEPWQIALVGPPNVGKSSLINALVGFERVVVHAEPGTTRDVVTAHSVIDGWPVQFSDTAGLRATDEPLEAEGIRRSLAESQQAELLVLVLDASCGLQALTDSTVTLQRQPDLVVWNKADLIADPSQLPAGCLLVSARTGAGLPELLVALRQVLVPISPPPGAAVAWTTEQIQWLHAARLWAVAPMDPAC